VFILELGSQYHFSCPYSSNLLILKVRWWRRP